jgi:hypothetical protein
MHAEIDISKKFDVGLKCIKTKFHIIQRSIGWYSLEIQENAETMKRYNMKKMKIEFLCDS